MRLPSRSLEWAEMDSDGQDVAQRINVAPEGVAPEVADADMAAGSCQRPTICGR